MLDLHNVFEPVDDGLAHRGQAEEGAKKVLSMFPTHLAPHLLLGEIIWVRAKLNYANL